MRIGVNARTFSATEPGGAVQAAMNLTHELSTLSERPLTLFGRDKGTVEGRLVNHGYVVDSRIYGLVWEQSLLPVSVNLSAVDVLLCPNGNIPLPGVNKPTVVCIHDIMNYLGYSTKSYQLLQKYRLPVVLDIADAIITVSEFSKSEIQKHFDIQSEKIHVVYNGVSSRYLEDSTGTPTELPDEYILFVGGAHGRKNIEGVIAAFRILQNKYGTNKKLVLIGPSKKANYSKSGVDWDAIRDDEDIIVKGYVTEGELKFAYSHADLFVYPSYYEGFGLPPIEAAACGTPVVVSDRTALPEILRNSARFADPDSPMAIANEIFAILSDESLELSLIERGKSRASQFTWHRAAEDTMNVLKGTAKDI